MSRAASPFMLAATASFSAGLTACVIFGLSASHAETLASKAAPTVVSAQIAAHAMPAAARPSAAKPDTQWTAVQQRSARMVYPSHFTSQR